MTRLAVRRCAFDADCELLGRRSARTALQQAATRLYDAEVALHHARQTHVDEWISAASERLHTAVEAYLAAVTAQVA